MLSRIEFIDQITLAGKKTQLSLAENKTRELWQSFMPEKKNIDSVGAELYSAEQYPENYFNQFDARAVFTKWAALKTADKNNVPGTMEVLVIPAGEYAVFTHKGPASAAMKTYGYIFNEWLPRSEFQIDHRPHFAVMGEKYKNDSDDSEEEIFIPVRRKTETGS